MPAKKKTAPKKRHPRVKQAIADVEKIHSAHKKLELDLVKAKRNLMMIPHTS